jgi:predicted glutamine amidotransferase
MAMNLSSIYKSNESKIKKNRNKPICFISKNIQIMCRILYLLHQPYTKSKINTFLSHATTSPVALDGYGLAVQNPDTKKWRIYKTPVSPQNDAYISYTIDEFAMYPLIIGHIRNANVINAPKLEDLTAKYENAHPFYYKNHVFLHNGHIEDAYTPMNLQWFEANTLPELWTNRKGHTDSECLFYLLLSTINKRKWLYQDIDMLENKGCQRPSKEDELKDAVQECYHLLDQQFHTFVANFIYADKDYSIVGRWIKNATKTDIASNKLYVSSQETKHRIAFCTEPIGEDMIPVKWGTFYIIRNADAQHIIHYV